MPTYEYVCDSCENRFELMQRMKDDPVKECPKCGKAVRRVLSGGIGISFKGSGFYVNDSNPASSGTTGGTSGTGGKGHTDGACSCAHAKADSPACPGKSGCGS